MYYYYSDGQNLQKVRRSQRVMKLDAPGELNAKSAYWFCCRELTAKVPRLQYLGRPVRFPSGMEKEVVVIDKILNMNYIKIVILNTRFTIQYKIMFNILQY